MKKLQIKRIYDPPSSNDGARILVDRIWPRGISKETAHLTLWLKDIAPTTALRKWFGHDPARWNEFQQRYRTELNANKTVVERLASFLQAGHVTLLYGARDPIHNQAAVLADYLLDRNNDDHGHPSPGNQTHRSSSATRS